MYEDGDAELLHERIREMVEQRTRQASDGNPFTTVAKKLTREELSNQAVNGSKKSSTLDFKDFKKIILDF